MKLNGWHRLLILLCIIYLAVVVSYVIIEFPKAKNIQHSTEFYSKLSKKSAQMIEPATSEKETPEESIKVKMPNGHIIAFKNKYPEKEAEVVCLEYWRLVEQKAKEKRVHLLLYAFLFWLVPCFGLYAFGWGISWVYKGFKSDKTAQQSG